MLRETSTADAPWTIVEGTDERYRHLTVGKVLLETLKGAIAPSPADGAAIAQRGPGAERRRQRRADPQSRPVAEG